MLLNIDKILVLVRKQPLKNCPERISHVLPCLDSPEAGTVFQRHLMLIFFPCTAAESARFLTIEIRKNSFVLRFSQGELHRVVRITKLLHRNDSQQTWLSGKGGDRGHSGSSGLVMWTLWAVRPPDTSTAEVSRISLSATPLQCKDSSLAPSPGCTLLPGG